MACLTSGLSASLIGATLGSSGFKNVEPTSCGPFSTNIGSRWAIRATVHSGVDAGISHKEFRANNSTGLARAKIAQISAHVSLWHIAAPDVCDGTSAVAKADTAFQGASVGQPTEPCLAAIGLVSARPGGRFARRFARRPQDERNVGIRKYEAGQIDRGGERRVPEPSQQPSAGAAHSVKSWPRVHSRMQHTFPANQENALPSGVICQPELCQL